MAGDNDEEEAEAEVFTPHHRHGRVRGRKGFKMTVRLGKLIDQAPNYEEAIGRSPNVPAGALFKRWLQTHAEGLETRTALRGGTYQRSFEESSPAVEEGKMRPGDPEMLHSE
jgi:hypothetical protein